MTDARTIIAEALQRSLAGDGTVCDVPQTCLAESLMEALSAQGLVIVPREPTKLMLDAFHKAHVEFWDKHWVGSQSPDFTDVRRKADVVAFAALLAAATPPGEAG